MEVGGSANQSWWKLTRGTKFQFTLKLVDVNFRTFDLACALASCKQYPPIWNERNQTMITY